MKNLLVPNFYVDSIYNINFDFLRERGIKNLIIDIDNTLMKWGSKDPDERVRELVKNLRQMGFNICLLSNSKKERVMRFRGDMDIEYYSTIGIKPMRHVFSGAIKKLGGSKKDTCIIGDQIFTDILGGNSKGIYTILVDPIHEKEFTTTRWIRNIERNIRAKLKYEEELRKGE